MGVEHPQMDAVNALFTGSPADYAPTPDLLSPAGKTPNQRALSCALALAWAHRRLAPLVSFDDAIVEVRDLFQAMATYGHQAVGTSYGCEEGAPDPHSALWLGAMATLLREARRQGIPDVIDLCVGYFADHVAMGRAFWTPAGIRMPCSRAKALPGQALRPAWTVDSVAYAMIGGQQVATANATLGKADLDPLKVLADSSALFPQILARSMTASLKLAVPIRRWPRAGGGFIAAMVEDQPMNDRMSWLIVDEKGSILATSNTLGDFEVPASDPIVIGAGGQVPLSFPALDASPPPPPAAAAAPTPMPPPPPPVATLDLPALAAQVRALDLAKSQAALKEDAAKAIEDGRLADALLLVKSFGIGEGQPQAASWHAIRAALAGA